MEENAVIQSSDLIPADACLDAMPSQVVTSTDSTENAKNADPMETSIIPSTSSASPSGGNLLQTIVEETETESVVEVTLDPNDEVGRQFPIFT